MTTTKDLLVRYKDFRPQLTYSMEKMYPQNGEWVEEVYNSCLEKEIVPVEEDRVINITTMPEEGGVDVHIVKPNDSEKYSLSFTPWDEFISYPIADTVFENFSEEEVLIHIIWEMTFFGDEESTNEARKDLEEALAQANAGNFTTKDLQELFDEID